MSERGFFGEFLVLCKNHFAQSNPLKKIKNRFWPRRKAGQAANIGSSKTRSFTTEDPVKQKKIHDLCQKIFENKELVVSGKLQFIGLSAVKKRLGHKWAGFQQCVYEIADSVIQLYLQPGDFFIRYEDDTYLIIFAQSSQEEGKIKATLIAEEISRRLFDYDEESAKDMSIVDEVRETSTRLLKDSPDFRTTVGRIYPSDTQCRQPSHEKAVSNTKADGNGHAVTAEKEQKTMRPDIQPVEVSAQRNGKSTVLSSPSEETKMDAFYSPVDEAPARLTIEPAYAPVWNIKKLALTMYICMSKPNDEARSHFSAHKNYVNNMLPSERETYEIALLEAAIMNLGRLGGSGQKSTFLFCPVHYETLSRPSSWEKYKIICQKIPPEHISNLVILIYDFSALIHRGNVQAFIAPLKNYCRYICAEVPLNHACDFASLYACGIKAVGVTLDLPSYSQKELKMFRDKVKKNNICFTFILGARTTNIITGAVCAQYDFIGGPAIHDLVDFPQVTDQFKYSKIYEQMSKSNNNRVLH